MISTVGRPCRVPCRTLTTLSIHPLSGDDGLVGLQAPVSALFLARVVPSLYGQGNFMKSRPGRPSTLPMSVPNSHPPMLVESQDCTVIVDMVASVTPVGRPCRGPCHTLSISPLVMNDGHMGLQAPANALFHAQSHAHNLMPFCHTHIVVSQV